MAESESYTRVTNPSRGPLRLRSSLSAWFERSPDRNLAVLAFALGASLTLAYHPFKQLERGDPAIYDYIAQSILRGQMPYRDIIDPKAPASMFLSAVAMAAGKFIGVSEVYAVRGLHILLVGLLTMVVYLVAESYLRNRTAAVIACLIPLMRDDIVTMMLEGTQPKLSMMIFGMLAMLFIAKDRPLWAGIFSMLSCLCWQPGLLFTGTAVLIFSRYLTRWRDLRAVKVIAGAIVPIALTALYFYLRGAFGPLIEWTLIYPYSVFAPRGERPLGAALGHLWRVTYRVFQRDVVVLGMSVIGAVTFAVERLLAKRKWRESLKSTDLFRDAILIPPVVYLVFCLINMQGGVDLIPFLPFIGIFGGWFFVEAAQLIDARRVARASVGRLTIWLPRVALAFILLIVLTRAAAYRFEGWSLQYQNQLLKDALADVGPNDKIYVHSTAEILLLLNRPNLNPYISFDSGADDYIASKTPGGFGAVIEGMEAEAPKFIAISRLRNVTHRAELEEWVAEHYERMPINGYDIYVRKEK